MMIRAGTAAKQRLVIARCTFWTQTPVVYQTATSKQKKRVLDPSDLSGTPPVPAQLPVRSGGSSVASAVALGAIAIGGALYYYNSVYVPAPVVDRGSQTLAKDVEKAVVQQKKAARDSGTVGNNNHNNNNNTNVAVDQDAQPEVKPVPIDAVSDANEEVTLQINPSKQPGYIGNRVSLIPFPATMRKQSIDIPSTPEHPVDGNRVRSLVPSNGDAALDDTSLTTKSLEELKNNSLTQMTPSMVLQQTKDKASDVDNTESTNNLSMAELHAKIAQLSTELQDRTKWEALRLQEFMALKEKETADRYLELMQKQRIELEDILARRLRDQEYSLATQARQALDEKEAQVKTLLDTALQTQKEEYEQEQQIFQHQTKSELIIDLEKEYSKRLESYKQQMEGEMTKKANALENLSKQLSALQDALSNSQSSQAGSSRAHRISAAALALSDKLDTSQGAAQEWQALKTAAGKDGVISTAVATLPPAVMAGVPTLAELQTKFDEMYSQCRQAALVPEGRVTVGGQLAGMVLSTLKYAPHPDDPAPEDNPNHPEFVLVRVKKHVQLGELEAAMEWMEKLKGQTSFTLKDWKKDAMDRIAVDKARKVIKMECALLNESLA